MDEPLLMQTTDLAKTQNNSTTLKVETELLKLTTLNYYSKYQVIVKYKLLQNAN